jgi:cysteinyl-tRNA synthetase
MTLTLYNTLSRKKEVFTPFVTKKVGFYSCGPTVYWFQHIGNLRTYIFNDILKRVLLYDGFTVKHVMNYTDVGHLTSDADSGEDKMEKAAAREHRTATEIASEYASVFEADCKKLNIIPPSVTCKATEHIPEQIALIKVLEEKGFTYRTIDGIYFDTAKLEDYGALGRIDTEGLEAGKRIDMAEKRNKTDFALWKFSDKPGVRQQEWDSPWGLGFPGWHIECSAMSSKYLGEQFDIHTGGEDHIQVHHTNEIAQSEAAFGKKPWVKYWLHGAFLTFKGEKVSKSTGGLFTVSELESQGFSALDYRYLCLNTHYKKQLSFSLEVLEGAKNGLSRLSNIILDLKSKDDSCESPNLDEYKGAFQNAIDDDLNMPQALSILWNALRDTELGSREKLTLALDFDRVLGLGLAELKQTEVNVDKDIEILLKLREKARKDKDFKKADEIRDLLKTHGLTVDDTPNGPRVRKI